MRTLLKAYAVLKLIASLILASLAYSANAKTNTFDIYFGVYRPLVETSIDLDSTVEGLPASAELSFEDDLDLDDSATLPFFSLTYHWNKRWRATLNYFSLSRDSQIRIDEELVLGNTVLELTDLIDTCFDVKILRTGVIYDFWQKPSYSLGLAFGVHITEFDLRISDSLFDVDERLGTTAPLPYIGFNAQVGLSKRLTLSSQLEYLQVDINDIDGSLLNATLSLNRRINQRIDIGTAIDFYKITVAAPKLDDVLDGVFKYTYTGPLVYIKYKL